MERPSPDAPEHEKALWWRKVKMGVSRDVLAGLTGYSVSSIKDMEHPTKEIDVQARRRYRLACAAATMGMDFDWFQVRISTDKRVSMVFGDDPVSE